MTIVVQLIITDADNRHFEPGLINGDWHASLSIDNRTVCGIQLDGDDGYAGEAAEGVVTCPICLVIIEEIKAMRNWK